MAVATENFMGKLISQGHFQILKRQAKRLEREHPALTHSQALDQIAKEQGYENWSLLARDVEQPAGVAEAKYGYPYTFHLRGIVSGSNITLTSQFLSKYPASHYANHQWIDWKTQKETNESPYHTTALLTDAGKLHLEQQLATAQRVISFMDATGLRPSMDFVGVFGSHSAERLDHCCIWKDEAKRYIVTAEPYMGSGMADELRAFCNKRDWSCEVMPKGHGLWAPCNESCSPDCNRRHTQMYVIAPKRRGGELQSTVRAILKN